MRAPPTRIRVFFFEKSEIFSFVLAFRPHVNGVFGRQKSRFPNASPEWSFLKTLAYRFRADERKQVFWYYMLSYFHRFSVFVWMGESDLNTLRVDAYFYENGGKNLRCQKYPDIFGQGLI